VSSVRHRIRARRAMAEVIRPAVVLRLPQARKIQPNASSRLAALPARSSTVSSTRVWGGRSAG
jgi:hypothetical protein